MPHTAIRSARTARGRPRMGHWPIALAAAVAAITACTAPGGPADTTPPTVVARVPAPGSTNVWIGAPISVTFSEPMRIAGFDPNDARVATGAGAQVAVAWTWSSDGTVLHGAVIERPDVPATLTLTLGASLADAAGNPLEAPAQAHTWEVPAWHALGGALDVDAARHALDPSVATGVDGAPVVAWHERAPGDGLGRVQVRRWDATTGTWDTLLANHAVRPEGDASRTSVVVDDSGGIHVAWTEDDLGLALTFVARYEGLGAWQVLDPHPLPDPGALYPTHHMDAALATGPDGLVVRSLRWSHVVGPYGRLEVWSADDEAWEAYPWTLAGPGGDIVTAVSAPAVDGEARAIVAFAHALGSGMPDVWSVARSVSPTAAAITLLPDYGGIGGGSWPVRDVVVAVDGLDRPHAAWRELPSGSGSDWNVRVARYDEATDSWTPLGGILDTVATNPAGEPSLAIDPLGRPLVAWHENDGGNRDVHVRRWEPSVDGWVALGGVLDRDPERNAFEPRLALDADGYPVVAWHESVGGVFSVFAARYNGP